MVYKTYDKAVVHLSNDLSFINDNYNLVNILHKDAPRIIYRQIRKQIQHIQIKVSEITKLKL